MDWIERLFHISPDGGNGSLEFFFILSPMGAFLIGFLSLLWLRQGRKKSRK
jgi:hypothetical protein